MKFKVRNGYHYRRPNNTVVDPGTVFEATQEEIASQSWKVEAVVEKPAPTPVPSIPTDANNGILKPPTTKEIPKPPMDRAVKKGHTSTKALEGAGE